MTGVEILTWGTQGEENPYYYPVYHYLWGGSIGHSATKLTLPDNPATLALIQQYCSNPDEDKVIPHYRYRDHWIVYFSWWPGGLMEEFQDRIEATSGANVEYEQKWQSEFTETIEQQPGYLRYKLGAIYDWIFGKPQKIPKPIMEIVHPLSEEALDATSALAKMEAEYKEESKTFEELLVIIDSLEELIAILQMQNMIRNGKFELDDECRQAQAELAEIEYEMAPKVKAFKEQTTKLLNFRRYYYQEFASIGTAPEIVHLGLSEEFSAKRMLAKMREIVDGPYEFDKIYYNCSTVTREIMAAGLSESLKTSDCQPHLFDTPLKIHRFACQLQKLLINMAQKRFTPQFEAKQAQLTDRPTEAHDRNPTLQMRPL